MGTVKDNYKYENRKPNGENRNAWRSRAGAPSTASARSCTATSFSAGDTDVHSHVETAKYAKYAKGLNLENQGLLRRSEKCSGTDHSQPSDSISRGSRGSRGSRFPINQLAESGQGNGGQRNEDQKTKSLPIPDSSDPDSPDLFRNRFGRSKRELSIRSILNLVLSPRNGSSNDAVLLSISADANPARECAAAPNPKLETWNLKPS